MDPLSISTGQGKGDAQVFQKDLTPAMGVEYQLDEKRRNEAQLEAQKKARDKANKDLFDNIDELNVTGYLPHVNYLNKQKDAIRDYITDQYVKTKGKYDATVDPVVGKLVSTFKKENEMSTQIKDYAKTLPAMLTKENKDQYTDESVGEINRFLQLPLNEQVKYVEEKGKFPIPEPKPALVDPESLFKEMGEHLGKRKTTIETPIEGDMTRTVSSTGVVKGDRLDGVNTIIESGLKGTDPKAVKFVSEVENQLQNNPEYRLAKANGNTDKAQKIFQQEAQQEGLKRMNKYIPSEYSNTLQGGEGKGEKVLTSADVRENVPVTLYRSGLGKSTQTHAPYGVTLPSNVSLNIPATENIIDARTGKPLEDYDQTPYTGDLSITGGKILSIMEGDDGNNKIKLKPYLFSTTTIRDEEGKAVKKDVRVPLDEIKGNKVLEKNSGGINELEKKIDKWNEDQDKKSSTKDTEKDEKSISLSDAKAANPNFKGTDTELIDRYSKHGYKIK